MGGLISLEDLALPNKSLDYALSIDTWFKNDGVAYIKFFEIPGYYAYDPNGRSWSRADSLNFGDGKQKFNSFGERIFTDPLGNQLRHESVDNTVFLSRHLKNKTEDISLDIGLDRFPVVASRNLERELYLEHRGRFYHITFENKRVTTFLNDKSIRGMLELSPEEILVASENNGWFVIDLQREVAGGQPANEVVAVSHGHLHPHEFHSAAELRDEVLFLCRTDGRHGESAQQRHDGYASHDAS